MEHMTSITQAATARFNQPRATTGATAGAWPQTSHRPSAARRTNYDHGDDASLIQSCLDGDEEAWEKLVRRYANLVYSIPRRLGLSAADADDVLQNVFTIAFRRLSSLKNRQCLAAWLITIARRECLHYAKRTPEYENLAEEISDGGSHLSAEVEQQQRRLLVHQALGLLDQNSQTLVSALFLEMPTPSYEEIANRLGMAVGSIGPARARCLKKLENVLLAMDADSVNAIASEL
jgi:RNA polymerase sigma factor (sigma-70 family)